MSAYAPYPISGFLPQPYISTLSHPSGFGPSGSAASLATTHYSLLQRRRLPEIVIEDTSLDTSFDGTINDPSFLLKTPAKHWDARRSSPSGSPAMSWLDEDTLTNTPCTALSQKKTLSLTPKHGLRSSGLSTTTLVHPEGTISLPLCSETELATEDPLDQTPQIENPVRLQAIQNIPLEESAVPPCPRRVPKLRRSNGKDDLHTLYRQTASPPSPSDARARELSFEEQLTLAILAEMARAPDRFLAPPAKSGLRPTSLLSTVSNALRAVRLPMSRVW